ncbi:MAG: 50S ribosomal protein L25 [Isosphaeraceae bacterium]|nr:50S ribosomal protein L25 [Isosphaeraceae bacterium]
MAETITITAQKRDPQKNKGTGTRVARRLRAQGRIPAIVYGHKQAPQPISLSRDDVWQILKKQTHLAQLQIDGTSEMVLVRDVQWDHLGKEIIHLDFARVSAEEMIETKVPLVLHGHAPGVAEGGILEMLVHEVHVLCRATAIPDGIRVELGGVGLHQGVHARDLTPPEGVTIKEDPELLLLHIITKAHAVEPSPTTEGTTAAEPEVIGRKTEEKGEEKEGKKEK